MILRKLLTYLLLPPTGNVLVALAAGWLLRRRRWLRRGVVTLALGSLLLLATPNAAYWLRAGLERYPAVTPEQVAGQAQAIVVLGGGRDFAAPEYGGADQVNARTLQRLQYGAWLARRTGLPLLVSGGRVFDEPLSEAELMARVLVSEFRQPVRWREGRSRTTQENARYSRELLRKAAIDRIALVTHAWHMPRAVMLFEQAGFQVLPAPTGFATVPPATAGLLTWTPQAYYLWQSSQALREYLGLAWYRARRWLG